MKAIIVAVLLVFVPVLAMASTPIENESDIAPELRNKHAAQEALVELVRGNGYTCDSISGLRRMVLKKGYVLNCNHMDYTFDIEDKGGKWIVTVD